ncbi:TonB family protein / TonB-dependent receptor [Enhygromyxa salina]|uniref:TonB family protein / TonB-dependent receptor n=1 Tax=Enhygromyxa salina TaxID=215803 RepID=A0A0C2D2I6_9BACT|nr:TonB-dependent receptor [Enhygromyxa salina]KIG15980.1 TonB family protein / TonB-dependent receptor [Enhygromyxa salina]
MRRARWVGACCGLLTVLVSGVAWPAPPAPPSPDAQRAAPERVTVEGRVLEAGGARAPVSGAVVMLVDAPAGVRPGKPARDPLDPEAVTWMLRAETDADGLFSIAEVPSGSLRVVIVAGGYERLEVWAQAPSKPSLELFVEPEQDGAYRTEVAVTRERLAPPDHNLSGEQARHYAGSGDDPLLATLNLPGVARTPGGFGLLSLRGGNPTDTGFYLDGHPIPRAFHVVPIASVISPPMTDRVELSAGNYGPGYGSFSGGMVHVFSRAGRREGVHGQAHVDLFDLGLTTEAPVGPGAMHFGFRRSHIDAVVRGAEGVIGQTGILLPTYWDYLGRLDIPVRPNHELTLRALGAGDRLRARGPDPVPGQTPNLFDYGASFHRFDLDYRVDDGDWRVLVSPSIRLDSARFQQDFVIRRDATVLSGRVEVENDLQEWLTLHLGTDLVYDRWRRRERVAAEIGADISDADQVTVDESRTGQQARFGMWIATTARYRNWSFVPSLRLNLFAYAGRQLVRFDPRFEVHAQVHPKLEWFAKIGMFSIPVVASTGGASANLVTPNGSFQGGVADIPPYLLAYFDPQIEGEPRDRSAAATSAVQASTGVVAQLGWDLDLRGTLFWREVVPTTINIVFPTTTFEQRTARQRSMGLELMLRRALGPKLDGWIGYTLLWARVQRDGQDWIPAQFDQRHSLVLLLSAALPRNFRFGGRFRLVSGNPENTVLGGEASNSIVGWFYRPIRGVRGTTYQPAFHQLDLRIDKRWVLRRTSVTAYLDVQNVYNRQYPEVSLYTRDWSQRASLIGLPIYPSLGVQVDF